MSRLLQARLYALIEARRPLSDKNGPQILRLGTIKMLEEAAELAGSIALPQWMNPPIDELYLKSRLAFRNREWLDTPDGWTAKEPSADALTAFRAELVDLYICVLHLAEQHAMITGDDWDIEADALAKATADLIR